MKELNIKIKGIKDLNPIVEIDGKIANLTQNKFGNYEGKVQVEKDDVDVKVYRILEINSKLWILKHLFYYNISIFGLLDTKKEKKFVIIDCQLKLNLSGENSASLELTASQTKENDKAFDISCNCQVIESANKIFVDKNAKKRNLILRFVKVIVFLGLICGLIIGFAKILGF